MWTQPKQFKNTVFNQHCLTLLTINKVYNSELIKLSEMSNDRFLINKHDIIIMASRKIPRSDLIISTIKEVMKRRGVIQSQEDLCYIVLKRLKEYDKNYVLSPKRVKEHVIKIPNIEIKAKTKRLPKIKKLEYCPICKKKFDKIYGRNLLNQKIHIGYICKRCGFTTDLEAFMPMKYIFILKSSNKKYD